MRGVSLRVQGMPSPSSAGDPSSRRFLRAHLPPRKGRSRAELMKRLAELGVEDLPSLSRADAATLEKANIGPKESVALLTEARSTMDTRMLRDAGIPAASLKRYQEAGFARPEDFCFIHPVFLADRTGLSLETVYRHVTRVCAAMGARVPEKVQKARVEKGRQELMALPGPRGGDPREVPPRRDT